MIAEIGSQERADLEAEVRELRAALSQIADFVGAPRSEGERRPEAIVKRAKELITGISRAAMPQWMHVNDDPNVPRSTTWPTS
ncbi:MAG TPA: hypothetical protein VHX38_02945 [Pseudonocardiaceae bacterium]|nr:hypothetical protein [Pseudonocardiaceae bacterium]